MAALGALKALHDFRLAPGSEPTMHSQHCNLRDGQIKLSTHFVAAKRNIPPFILAKCRFIRRLWENILA
jgi:hypothetical protein